MSNLVVSTGNADVAKSINNLFNGIDFASINQAIENISNIEDITDKQVDSAVEVVKSWENNVVNRLRQKNTEMNNIIMFFKNDDVSSFFRFHTFSEEQVAIIAENTGTTKLYEKLKESYRIADNFISENEPEKLTLFDDMTVIERTELKSAYDLEFLKYKTECAKKFSVVKKDYTVFMNTLKNTDVVKNMVAQARLFEKNYDRLATDCKVKSDLAKLNISIRNKDLRDNLKDMINFVSTI